MKKDWKTARKLTLSKETLRNLEDSQLEQVAGGDPSRKYTNCGSCGIACTIDTCV